LQPLVREACSVSSPSAGPRTVRPPSKLRSSGSKGAYWDARVFLRDWGFDCKDIEVPVSLFYGTADKNVPLAMGEYYQRWIPDSKAVFYQDEGHFIMYSRAGEILESLIDYDA